jgi:rod shape-determining protein MreC
MLKRPHYIALAVVILLTLIVLKLPSRTAAQFKLAISGIFLPLFGLSGSAQAVTEKAGDAMLSKEELRRQVEQLRAENQELKALSARGEELSKENNRLRVALGWQKQMPWRLKPARVVGRDPANWWRNIKIDVGSRDGITNNMAVLTADGLVGRISEVGYSHSTVVLVGDSDCRVSVFIEDEGSKSRDNGVIAPNSSSPLNNQLVDLGYISQNAALRPGQKVLTSGLGGIFPKGILVGEIVDSRIAGFGLYPEARVRLAVKMNALEEVFVKLP